MGGAYVIRAVRCTLAEARALLAVERQTLGDSLYTADEVLDVLRRPEHHAYVATQADQMVGFSSCIETLTVWGKRLEIDMLGVLPTHRHRGLGTALVTRSIRAARDRGVRDLRAVVAADNVASQVAFRRAGLAALPHPFDMLIYEITGVEPVAFLPEGWTWQIERDNTSGPPGGYGVSSAVGGSHLEVHSLRDQEGTTRATAECLEVHTLAYRGLWLEALWGASPRAIRLAARVIAERGKALGLDEVGYLARPTNKVDHGVSNSADLVREGYQNVGSYLVFSRVHTRSS